jgi:hypothetical protein
MDSNMNSDMNTGMDVTMEQTPGMDMDILIWWNYVVTRQPNYIVWHNYHTSYISHKYVTLKTLSKLRRLKQK